MSSCAYTCVCVCVCIQYLYVIYICRVLLQVSSSLGNTISSFVCTYGWVTKHICASRHMWNVMAQVNESCHTYGWASRDSTHVDESRRIFTSHGTYEWSWHIWMVTYESSWHFWIAMARTDETQHVRIRNYLQISVTAQRHCNTLQDSATHAATRCNTLQHTATTTRHWIANAPADQYLRSMARSHRLPQQATNWRRCPETSARLCNICIYIYIYIYIRIFICVRVCICVCICIDIQVLHEYKRGDELESWSTNIGSAVMHVCICICTRKCMCVLHAYIHTCTHMTYTCTYTHARACTRTHIHTCIRALPITRDTGVRTHTVKQAQRRTHGYVWLCVSVSHTRVRERPLFHTHRQIMVHTMLRYAVLSLGLRCCIIIACNFLACVVVRSLLETQRRPNTTYDIHQQDASELHGEILLLGARIFGCEWNTSDSMLRWQRKYAVSPEKICSIAPDIPWPKIWSWDPFTIFLILVREGRF